MANGNSWVSANVSEMAVSAIKEMAIRAAEFEDVASLIQELFPADQQRGFSAVVSAPDLFSCLSVQGYEEFVFAGQNDSLPFHVNQGIIAAAHSNPVAFAPRLLARVDLNLPHLFSRAAV